MVPLVGAERPCESFTQVGLRLDSREERVGENHVVHDETHCKIDEFLPHWGVGFELRCVIIREWWNSNLDDLRGGGGRGSEGLQGLNSWLNWRLKDWTRPNWRPKD